MERSPFGAARSVFGATVVKSKTSLKARPENARTPSWRNRQSGGIPSRTTTTAATTGSQPSSKGTSSSLRYGSSSSHHKSPVRATRKLNIRAAPKPADEADDELAKLERAAIQAQAEVDRKLEEKKAARRAAKQQKEGTSTTSTSTSTTTNGRPSWAAKKRADAADGEIKRWKSGDKHGVTSTPVSPSKPRNGVLRKAVVPSSPPKRTSYALSPKRSIAASSTVLRRSASPQKSSSSGDRDSPIAYQSPVRYRSPRGRQRIMATTPTSPVRTSPPSRVVKSPGVVQRPSSPPGKTTVHRTKLSPTKTITKPVVVPKRTFTRHQIRTAVKLQAWWRGACQRRKFLEVHKYAKKIVKLQTKLETLRTSKAKELADIQKTVKEYKEETKAKLKKKKDSMANSRHEAVHAEQSAVEQKKENAQIRAKNELLKKNSRNLRINNLRLEKSSESSGDYYAQLKAHHDRCVEDNKKLEKVETNYKAKVEEMESNLSVRTKYANTEHKICALYRGTIRDATTLGEESNDENLILTLYQIVEEIEHLEKDWKDEDIASPVKPKSKLKGKKKGNGDDWLAKKPTLRGKSNVSQPPLAKGGKILTKAVSKRKVTPDSDSDSPAESPPKATKAKVIAVQSRYKSKAVIASDSDSDSEDAKPVTKKVVTSSTKPATTGRSAKPASDSDSDSDSDDAKPITKRNVLTTSVIPIAKKPAKPSSDSDSDSSDDNKPTRRVNVKKKSPAPTASTADSESDSSSSEGDVRKFSPQQTASKAKVTQSGDTPESDSDSYSSESEVSALTEPTGRGQSRRSSLDSSDSDSSDSS